MNIGDKVRLKSRPPCQEILGLREGQVGVVKDIETSADQTAVLISFPDVDFYTTALRNDDFEVLQAAMQPECCAKATG